MDDASRRRFTLHARLPVHRRRIAYAEAVIAEWLDRCHQPSVSVSWGKDSLVCLHLARRQRPDIPVIWCDRGEGGDLPETYALVERLTGDWGLNLRRVESARSIFQVYADFGSDAPRRHLKQNLVDAMARVAGELGLDGQILGLRGDESIGRDRAARFFGPIYATGGLLRATPIVRWTARDVWAYIVAHRIPYLPIYDDFHAIGVDYESPESRTSNWAGTFMAEAGRLQRLRALRPALWQTLVRRFPELRALS